LQDIKKIDPPTTMGSLGAPIAATIDIAIMATAMMVATVIVAEVAKVVVAAMVTPPATTLRVTLGVTAIATKIMATAMMVAISIVVEVARAMVAAPATTLQVSGVATTVPLTYKSVYAALNYVGHLMCIACKSYFGLIHQTILRPATTVATRFAKLLLAGCPTLLEVFAVTVESAHAALDHVGRIKPIAHGFPFD